MEADMAAAIADFELRHQVRSAVAGGAIQMLGTSGTVTTLAGVHKDLLRYDREAVDGSYLDMATVRAISARITGMTYAERRSEEHTSELQSLMRNSYAVFCLKKKKPHNNKTR